MRAGLGRLESNVGASGRCSRSMAAPSVRRARRQRGSIEEPPSGALRVPMYAGIDSLTGRRHYLKESIPACPSAHVGAQKVMRRLTNQVDERCNLSDQRNGHPVA